MNVNPSRIKSNIDLKKHGYQVGELMIPWSDNTTPLGYHPIPFINIRSGKGKSLLVIGGNHGDEFEGPAAILRISQKIIFLFYNHLQQGLTFHLYEQHLDSSELELCHYG